MAYQKLQSKPTYSEKLPQKGAIPDWKKTWSFDGDDVGRSGIKKLEIIQSAQNDLELTELWQGCILLQISLPHPRRGIKCKVKLVGKKTQGWLK